MKQPKPTIGRDYNHKSFGRVTVTEVRPNDTPKMPLIIHFRSQFGTEYQQGINGFNFNVGITKTPWI